MPWKATVIQVTEAERKTLESWGRASSTEQRLLAQLDEPPPAGQATGSGSRLAAAVGEVSAPYVWRVLRRQGINLRGSRS